MPLLYASPPARRPRSEPQLEGPLDWITSAAKTVAHGVVVGAKGVATGATYVGKGALSVGKTIGGYALVVAKDQRTWELAVAGAGLYFGIPPEVTLIALQAFKKTGKVPPGTDPRLAAYIEQSQPKNYTPYYIAGGAGVLLLILLLTGRRRGE